LNFDPLTACVNIHFLNIRFLALEKTIILSLIGTAIISGSPGLMESLPVYSVPFPGLIKDIDGNIFYPVNAQDLSLYLIFKVFTILLKFTSFQNPYSRFPW
jgi:hypothetical protein